MAEYPLITGKTACIWARIETLDTPRYVQAIVYRPDNTVLYTLNLVEVRAGYHEDKTQSFNGDDYWRVEFIVYKDAGYTNRDFTYVPKIDYLWRQELASGGGGDCIVIGGAIDLVLESKGEAYLEKYDSSEAALYSEEGPFVSLGIEDVEDQSLQIEEKPIIELEYECKE